jgi:glutaredoxin
MNGKTVTLYTRKGCHLCDDAEALLRRLGYEPAVIDVDSDPALQARYGDEVPVLAVEGEVLLSGVILEDAIRATLAPTRPRESLPPSQEQ